MIVHNFDQCSPKWHTARQGVITATDLGPFILEPRAVQLNVKEICAELESLGIPHKKSGKRDELIDLLPNIEQYKRVSNAALRLIIEKIKDSKPKDSWQLQMEADEERKLGYNIPIQRGKTLEPAARAYYEKRTGHTVTQVGFITDDNGDYGCSPDNLVYLPTGKIGHGNEIKCPMPETHLRWLYDGVLPPEHEYQCHMGMVCCEVDRWDFLSYCPGEANLLIPVYRNELTEKIAAGLKAIIEEKRLVEAKFAALWEAEYGSEVAA